MIVGNFGAYIADDDWYYYYLFKCTSESEEADRECVFEVDGNECPMK